METRASYILVGTFVLVLTASVFGFAMWLARVEFETVPKRYAIYFTGSVTGLSVGSPVRYRGVPVGTVSDIRLDPDHVERIRVLAEIADDAPIKVDTVASLGLQGITGVAYVLLSGGTQSSARLSAAPGQDVPVITSEASALQTVLEKAPEIFEKAVILVERLTRLVDDRNLDSIAGTLENIRDLSDSLAERRKSLGKIIAEGESTMSSVRGAAANIDALTGKLTTRTETLADGMTDTITDTRATLADIRGATRSIGEVAARLGVVVDENRAAFKDFSSGGLYELSLFVSEARQLVAALTRLSGQIEQDPARFFFGDTQKGFEAK